MNSLQKQYELKNRMFSKDQKIDISEYFKFIEQVRTRPNQFSIQIEKPTMKRFIYEPFKDPSVIASNRRHKLRLYNIIEQPTLPKLNNVYLEVRETLKHNKDRSREFAEKALNIENSKFIDRIFNQRSRVDEIKGLIKHRNVNSIKSSKSKDYESDYRQFQKKQRELILPDINGQRERRNSEKLFQTEVNAKNKNYINEQPTKNGEKLKDHNYKDISHHKQGHING